jgi:CheY-like chemotaxis protein
LPHVLLVDDEPGIRFVLRRWFERQQWAVSEAGDGQSAMTELLASADAVADAPHGTVLAHHPHVRQKPFEFAALESLVASSVSA